MSGVAAFLSLVDRLNETVQYAYKYSSHYHRSFTGLNLTFTEPAEFAGLPVLDRHTLATGVFDILVTREAPVTVSMSGGTTSVDGRPTPIMILKNEAESRYRRELIDKQYAALPKKPLIMQLVNLGHGYDTYTAVPGVYQMALERPFHFEAILRLLRNRFTVDGHSERIEVLSGAIRHLKALTLLCLENSVPAEELGVNVISTTSNQLTPHWKRLLESYWGAYVDETYGLSEVPGLNARRCRFCTRFHFGAHAYVETVSLDGSDPVEEGLARVIGTSVLPLAQQVPIIRYDTEDVIEMMGTCDRNGVMAFEFVGRARDLVRLPGLSEPLVPLPPVAVNRVLDGYPEVATRPFKFTADLELRSVVGRRKWRVRWEEESKRLAVDIELVWSPSQYPERAADLRARMVQDLLAGSAVLRSSVASGLAELTVNFQEPGSTTMGALV